MRLGIIFYVFLFVSTNTWSASSDLKPFDFQIESNQPSNVTQNVACGFPALETSSDFAVFAAGAYAGRKLSFQIDQSGHEATQMDVAVNSPNKPVVLMLGAYEPTVWNIGWSKNTQILAVLISGYHRQAVAGLEKNTPQLISSADNHGPCGYFYVTDSSLQKLNPMARRVFGKAVNMIFPAENGRVIIGDALQKDTKLVTSAQISPAAFYVKDAPMAGAAGLEDAVRKGILRKATEEDADLWVDSIIQNSVQQDIPPIANRTLLKPPSPRINNAYVILKAFTYPAGLYGAHSVTFMIPKGVPRPIGNPGHSAIYDFNTLKCEGGECGPRMPATGSVSPR
ncbi:hypothetical protein [Methylophilus sp. Leaf414]|uniref:hypothetical protein n=1 Tax=Methylophilus sp. Leaf414 TaxID=1736371 RepID=UPI0006F694C1|nr:hypothetical protein [Methylophilus sp. Leaf414]KQT36599.1 hypothetical protein ASG24_05415 [Methylophilus sp. Leaf414]